ncbi:MAG: prenyltransferase, partial [Bacillota bacterium]
MEKNMGSTRDWIELFRPFSYTASIIPSLLAGSMLYQEDKINILYFLLLLIGIIGVHTGANIVNEYYDFKNGIDNRDSKIASKVLMEERIDPQVALMAAGLLFLLFFLGAIFFTFKFQLPGIIIYALVGICGGYFYTAPPLNFKYRGLGSLCIFTLFGILLPQAVYFTFSGQVIFTPVFLPPAFLVTAIVLANYLGDRRDDREILTLAVWGRKKGVYIYMALIIACYVSVLFIILQGTLSPGGMMVVVTLLYAIN